MHRLFGNTVADALELQVISLQLTSRRLLLVRIARFRSLPAPLTTELRAQLVPQGVRLLQRCGTSSERLEERSRLYFHLRS